MTDPERALLREIARAGQELPDGPTRDRLRNYLTRMWEVLNTPDFRATVGPCAGQSPEPRVLDSVLAVCSETIEDLMAEGVTRRELRPVAPSGPARLLAATVAAHALGVGRPPAGRPGIRFVIEAVDFVVGSLRASGDGGTAL